MIGAVVNYLAYIGAATALLIGFAAVYVLVTPHPEIALIRAGNRAAAFSLGGAVIGMALPIASAAAHSQGLADMIVWGGISTLAQLLVFFGLNLALPGLHRRIADDDLAHGVVLAAAAIAVGLINAGCLTN